MSENTPEKKILVPDFVTLEYVTVKEVHSYLNDYLTYLIDLHKHYVVCFNKKEHYDKAVLDTKIIALTKRVNKLKRQLDKYTKDESTN